MGTKIKVWVQTNKVGSRCVRVIELDVDEEDFADDDGCTLNNHLEECAQDAKDEMIEWDWEIVKP